MGKKARTPVASPPPVTTPPAPSVDALTDQRERLYNDTYDELVKKQISNAENYDRSVLTLSASGLGLSLAIIKNVAPSATADYRWALIASWWLFGATIVMTMTSFLASQAAIRFQMHAAHKYYREHVEEYLNKESPWAKWTDRLNWASYGTFIAAIAATILFVTSNLPAKNHELPAKTNSATSAAQPGPADSAPVRRDGDQGGPAGKSNSASAAHQ